MRYFFLLLFTLTSFSQVNWNADFFTKNGKSFIKVHFNIEAGYHIYGVEKVEGPIFTQFELATGETLRFVQLPEAEAHFDEGFEIDINWYKGQGFFILEANAELNEFSQLSIKFQPCTDSYCLAPAETKINLNRTEFKLPEKSKEEKTGQKSYQDLKNQSLVAFIAFAISMGFLALLTPCVFPMIPITVSFFTKNGEESRSAAVKQGFLYGAGIVLIFTLFGFVISQLFGAGSIQNFAANPFVNLFIALLFIAFALSLFGLFEIELPSGIVNKINKFGVKPGSIGVIFAGVAFALVSFTCTVQFFGLLIVQAAQGEWFYPLIGMFFFSSAFALPFVFLAIFPQWIAQMPKSGSWLHSTKIVMAFVELAAAVKFFSQADLVWDLELFTRPFMLILWTVLFALSGLYLLGLFKLSKEDIVEKIGVLRLFNAIFFLSFALYLASGINGRSLQADLDAYLPPLEYGQNVSFSTEGKAFYDNLRWIEDYTLALKEAEKTGKSLFIDFTGKTCTNCRWMEKKLFTQKKIQRHLKKYILVRLWTDFGDKKEFNQNLQQRWFKSVALPYYAIVTADGNVQSSFAGMTRDSDLFEQFLK